MSIAEIARFAKIKGLNLVGTGDFTHPKWLREIQETLVPEPDTSLYKVASNTDSSVRFMLTTEVSTIFNFNNEAKKVHHVILTPSMETALQINDVLRSYGDLDADGRPMLNMPATNLVEEVMATSSETWFFLLTLGRRGSAFSVLSAASTASKNVIRT
jgi:PHP family Zn ribbon phosphoesterase